MSAFNPEKSLTEVRREFGEHGGVTPSVDRSSTYTVMDPHTMPDIFQGLKGPEQGGCFLYSRHFNPTNDTLSRYLAAMEGSEYGLVTASGMSAISSVVLQICKAGDHLVSSDTIYGGTHALFEYILPEMGIDVTFVAPDDTAAFENAARDNTKLFYTESVGNPTLKVADIPALSRVAKAKGIKLAVDNTFTPMIISPIQLGADIVVYSLTKYINGASDLIAGAVLASHDFIYQLMDLHKGRVMLLGPTPDPRVSFDIIQRLPHLALRMKEHSIRAMQMSRSLEDLGLRITYPGLKHHPQHDLMKTLKNDGFGYGGMFTVDCGTEERADAFLDHLQNVTKFGLIAVSLGYFDTLMSVSASSTSSEISADEKAAMGLSSGLVRISAGLTGSLEQRIGQLVESAGAVLLK